MEDNSIIETWLMIGPFLKEDDLTPEERNLSCCKYDNYHGQFFEISGCKNFSVVARVSNPSFLYEGQVVDGQITGSGRMIYSNKGEPNGLLFYQGTFKDSKRHGQGLLCFKDGSR